MFNLVSNSPQTDVTTLLQTYEKKKHTPIVYGIYDNRDQPLWVRLNDFLIDSSSVSDLEKLYFYQLLGVMLDAGMPIAKALKILAAQTKDKRFQRILDTVAHDVAGGVAFSVALSKFPAIFDEAEVGMIHSGESTGTLEQILIRLSDQLEKTLALTVKVKGALFYPVMVLFALAVALTLILIIVVPRLTAIFAEAQGQLPASTKLLIALSNFLQNWWWFLFLVLIGIYLSAKYFFATEDGKEWWDYKKLKLPIFGTIWQKLAISRFVRTLANLMGAGIMVSEALTLTGQAVGNLAYRHKAEEIRIKVEQGEKISAHLGGADELFPDSVVNMIEIGESSAGLEKTAEKIATQYDREVEYALKNLTAALEPITIGVLGLAIGFLALAVLSPIFRLSEIIQ
jgi:type IV pilus assembly protein PilC